MICRPSQIFFVIEELLASIISTSPQLKTIERQKNWIGHILQREIMKESMEWNRARVRPRQKLMDWVMENGYRKLKKKAQHREEWSRWAFGPAGRQIT